MKAKKPCQRCNELARDIAAPVWEFRALDPDGFDKWIKTIANRLVLFEKEVRKEESK